MRIRRRKRPVDRPKVFDMYLWGHRFVVYASQAGASRAHYDLRPNGVAINGWDVPDRFLNRGWMTMDDVPEEHLRQARDHRRTT
jgi:hypothetical protein